ncbi:MAG: hypothetical protein NTY83_00875 [Candidatus Micrarchaeota archaeon]|nr:hypothetical protein [Candidatus Micrarchaeota archaeon]
MAGKYLIAAFLILLILGCVLLNPPASQAALEKCNNTGVAEIYMCQGGIIRAVSMVPGAGSIYYYSNGSLFTQCPLVSPAAETQECTNLQNSCSWNGICNK